MSTHHADDDLRKIDAPWGKKVSLRAMPYEGGMTFIRIRIQENARFTDLELDPATAKEIADVLSEWAKSQPTS